MIKPDKSSPEFAALLGEAICGLARYFVGCGVTPSGAWILPAPGQALNGRDKLDPVYRQVTEDRDGPGPAQRKHYSSCGDQLHAILQRVGVRLPFVNRKSLHGFEYGVNLSRLQRPACPFAVEATAKQTLPPPGSLCLIWTTGLDGHALVILGPGSDDHHVLTANYGAGGMSEATAPGASLADSPLVVMPDGLHIGGSHRRLHTIITPASIVPYIDAQIDLTGAIVSDELIEALSARWDHE